MGVPKRNWQDDQFTGDRKYTMTQNADGTVSFVDVTEYSQTGSNITAAELNNIGNAVLFFTKTLAVADWAETSSGSGVYQQTISGLTGVTSTSNVVYGLNDEALDDTSNVNTTTSTFLSYGIIVSSTSTGTVTFKAKLGCPTEAYTLDLVVYNV